MKIAWDNPRIHDRGVHERRKAHVEDVGKQYRDGR